MLSSTLSQHLTDVFRNFETAQPRYIWNDKIPNRHKTLNKCWFSVFNHAISTLNQHWLNVVRLLCFPANEVQETLALHRKLREAQPLHHFWRDKPRWVLVVSLGWLSYESRASGRAYKWTFILRQINPLTLTTLN